MKTVTEEEFVTETVCEDIVTKSCDDLDCDLDPDNCEKCDDNEPSCQVVYKSETKRECSYETQIDKKCFRLEQSKTNEFRNMRSTIKLYQRQWGIVTKVYRKRMAR